MEPCKSESGEMALVNIDSEDFYLKLKVILSLQNLNNGAGCPLNTSSVT